MDFAVISGKQIDPDYVDCVISAVEVANDLYVLILVFRSVDISQ